MCAQGMYGGARLGTATRVGTTARLGTGLGAAGVTGASLNTDVTVTDRPVTQQGMAGVGSRLQSAGPRRQVQDLTYHLGVLRERITALSSELESLTREIERRRQDSTVVQSLERRYEDLVSQVRTLEGELADHNLAMDKHRAHTDPSELLHFRDVLRRRNEEEAQEIDRIFLRRQEQERGVERLLQQLSELEARNEARLDGLRPEAKTEYRRILERNLEHSGKVATLQAELEAVSQRIHEAEDELARDKFRDEYVKLERRMEALQREAQQLEEEKGETRLDPGEARARLLMKVKNNSAAIQELRTAIQSAQEEVEKKQRVVAELDADIRDRQSGASGEDKFEALFKRDQEMTEFLDRLPQTLGKEEEDQRRARETVVALLEHISDGIERERSMPSKEEAGTMREDLTDKQQELGASKETEERLREELARRREELQKIDTLDEKIGIELASLRTKMDTMRRDMAKFSDLDALRAASDEAQDMLSAARDGYRRRRDAAAAQATAAAARLDTARREFAALPKAKELAAGEERIRQYERAIFAMREDIASKAKATDFESLRDTCLALVTQVNQRIVHAQRQAIQLPK